MAGNAPRWLAPSGAPWSRWKDLFRVVAELYRAEFEELREQLRLIDGQKRRNLLLVQAAHYEGREVELTLSVSAQEEAALRARAVFAMRMASNLQSVLELL